MKIQILLSKMKGYLFLFCIICVLAFSIIIPEPGKFISDNNLLNILMFAAMLISGMGISFKNITKGLKNYKAIFYGVFAAYILFPFIVTVLFNLINSNEDLFIGATIMAAQSSTIATAVILTVAAGGNASLALIITILNNILSAFITPLVLKVTLSLNQQIDFDVKAMIIKLLWVLLLPVLIGQIFRLLALKHAITVAKYGKTVSQIIVLLFVMTGAATASSNISLGVKIIPVTILIASLVHIIMIFMSILYSNLVKIENENRSAIMFCSSQKTLPASLYVWNSFFSEYLYAPIYFIFYHIMQIVIDSIIVNIMNRKQKKEKQKSRGHSS